MAKVVANQWRSRILMELSVRPLSPSQFVDLVGGDLSEISRCFRKLAEWDFIEILETKKGGHRRGGIEHVYHLVHRALFDTSVWEHLPRACRDECSSSALESYIARIGEAIKAGTFDDELDRHLSWDETPLDRIAWTEVVTTLDEILYWLPDLELEAAERMTRTEEKSIPTTVGLSAFRSGAKIQTLLPRQMGLSNVSDVTPFGISPRIAKAAANHWRSRILMELSVRPLSPTQFVSEIGGEKRHISRCFRTLADWDFIEVMEIKSGGRRRGGKEKIYRLKQRAYFDTPTWEELPRFLRDECSASFLHSYFGRIDEAIEAGTFDADVDRHFSWDTVALDRSAWKEVISRLDQLLHRIPTLEKEAIERIAVSGEEPIPTVIGLMAFRSPRPSEIIS